MIKTWQQKMALLDSILYVSNEDSFYSLHSTWHEQVQRIANDCLAISGMKQDGTWEACAFNPSGNTSEEDLRALSDVLYVVAEDFYKSYEHEEFTVRYPVRVLGKSKACKAELAVLDAILTAKFLDCLSETAVIKVFDNADLLYSFETHKIDIDKVAEMYIELNEKLIQEALIQNSILEVQNYAKEDCPYMCKRGVLELETTGARYPCPHCMGAEPNITPVQIDALTTYLEMYKRLFC